MVGHFYLFLAGTNQKNSKLIQVIKIRNQNSPDRLIPEPNFGTLPKNTDHNQQQTTHIPTLYIQ